jgi:hypothetical protein
MTGRSASINFGANSCAVARMMSGRVPKIAVCETVAHTDDLAPLDLRISVAYLGRDVPGGFAHDMKRVRDSILSSDVSRERVGRHTSYELMCLLRVGRHIVQVQDRVTRHSITASARMRFSIRGFNASLTARSTLTPKASPIAS